MNRSQINKRIWQLGEESANIKNSYKSDPEYKKLQKELIRVEKKIEVMKAKTAKVFAARLSEIDEEIKSLKLQKAARSRKVLSPYNYGSEFNTWWNTVFIGINTFSKKQLMWIDEEKKHCLMKIVRDRGVDWYLYQVEGTRLIHHTEGRLNAIKLAAMESKIKTKIKL